VTLGLGAGIAKELVDLGGAGDPSWRDLTWDVLGTVTGVLVASAIDWVIRRTRAPATQTHTSN
jgi:putative lipoprotein